MHDTQAKCFVQCKTHFRDWPWKSQNMASRVTQSVRRSHGLSVSLDSTHNWKMIFLEKIFPVSCRLSAGVTFSVVEKQIPKVMNEKGVSYEEAKVSGPRGLST